MKSMFVYLAVAELVMASLVLSVHTYKCLSMAREGVVDILLHDVGRFTSP